MPDVGATVLPQHRRTFFLPEDHEEVRTGGGGVPGSDKNLQSIGCSYCWGPQRQGEGKTWGGGVDRGRDRGKGHSLCIGAGLVEEGEGDRAGHPGPHFPGAVEHGTPVEQTLEVLRLGLVPWEERRPLTHSRLRSFPSSQWLPTTRLITERSRVLGPKRPRKLQPAPASSVPTGQRVNSVSLRTSRVNGESV